MKYSHFNQHAQHNKPGGSSPKPSHKTNAKAGRNSGSRNRAVPTSAVMVSGMSSAKRKAIKVKAMANNLARLAKRYPRQLIEALDAVESDTSVQ